MKCEDIVINDGNGHYRIQRTLDTPHLGMQLTLQTV